MILSRQGPLTFTDFDRRLPQPQNKLARFPSEKDALLPLNEVIADHIYSVLNKTDGRINGPNRAAKILDMHPNTLRNRMIKLGIPFGKG